MTLFFSVPLARNRHPRMQNALVDSDRSASDLVQRTQRNVQRSLWSDTLHFFFVLVTKRETTRRSLTRPSLKRLMLVPLGRTWTTLLQWCVAACMRAATCALAWRVAGVQDHKANTSLTELILRNNKVGDAGATALAEPVKGTVLTCTQCVFRACACCYQRCHFTWRCEQLASSGGCAVCVAASAFFFRPREQHAVMHIVDVARFQNRLGQFSSELHTSRSPPALA